MVQFKFITCIIVIGLTLFSGCIVSERATPTPTPSQTPTVTATATPQVTATPLLEVTPTGKIILIKLDSDRGFIPAAQTIQPGDELVWSNYYTETVTLVSGDGLFNAQSLAYYQEYRYIFKKPGTYSFYLEKNKNLTGTITVSPVTAPTPTPMVAGPKVLPPNALYVNARMTTPAYWGYGNYSLNELQVQIYNQQNIPLSITAQIVSDGQILEEKSAYLEQEGSSYQFANDRRHYINSTDVTLRLLIQGYQQVEYKFKVVSSLG